MSYSCSCENVSSSSTSKADPFTSSFYPESFGQTTVSTMDYSAAIADDPAAASPWGSSSPRAQRGPFAGAAPDSPRTPGSHGRNESQSSLPEPAMDDSQAATNEGSFNGQQAPQTEGAQDRPAGSQQQQSTQPQHPHGQHAQQQQGQPRPGAARYHSARPQRPVPQYKLQAKVTALERTGRKDPVLRFDVYVRSTLRRLVVCANSGYRQTYPDSEPPSSVTSDEHTLNSLSYKSI